MNEELFGDYDPKPTKDTVADFDARMAEEIEKLPPAEATSLPALLVLLEKQKEKTAGSKGQWEDGNVILGADPKEYRPSVEEMMESAIGDRILAAASDAAEAARCLAEAGVTATRIEYGRIEVRHVDVMGSGRFTYASEPQKTIIDLIQ